MTSTAHVQETAQQQEERLWSQYLMAELDAQRIELQYHKAWRQHVMCDDTETGRMWDAIRENWRNSRDRAAEICREWKRVAYPLFGWPTPDDK